MNNSSMYYAQPSRPHAGFSLEQTAHWNREQPQPEPEVPQRPLEILQPPPAVASRPRPRSVPNVADASLEDQRLQQQTVREGNADVSSQYLRFLQHQQASTEAKEKSPLTSSDSSAGLTGSNVETDNSDASTTGSQESIPDKKVDEKNEKCTLSHQSQEAMLARFEEEAKEQHQKQLRSWAAQGLSHWISQGPTRPDHDAAPLPCPVDVLKAIKAEPLDTKVQVVLDSLPRRTIVDIIRLLCNAPDSVYDLCEKERGKIVTQVIATLKGEGCECLTDILCNHINHLANHRVACVALTRTYDALMTFKRPLQSARTGTNTARKASGVRTAGGQPTPDVEGPPPTRSILHFINRVLAVLPELACHPQGNFVCSAIFGPGSPVEAFDGLLSFFNAQPSFFLTLAQDKWGSHIIDAFVNNCPTNCMEKLVTFLQKNSEIVTQMAIHDIANYPLQNLLKNANKKLANGPAGGVSSQQQPAYFGNPYLCWLVENVPRLTMNSNHFGRITSALGLRGAAGGRGGRN